MVARILASAVSMAFALSAVAAQAKPQAQAQRIDTHAIDFGDDESEWANNGECDDMRFTGPGMTETPLIDDDVGHDSTDCRTAYEAGQLTLRGRTWDNIDFGDDSSDWANDGECDDARFKGPGMTSTALLEEDIMRDATDCRAAYRSKMIGLR